MKIDYFSALVLVDVKTRKIIRIICVFEDSHKAYKEAMRLNHPFSANDGTVYEVHTVEVELM